MGNVQFHNGKILFSAAPAIAMDPACCCEPCTDCAAATPDATVTVAGCVDANCTGAAGAYAFNAFLPVEGGCRWELTKVGYILYIYFTVAGSVWDMRIYQLPLGPGALIFDMIKQDTICAAGDITGTATLAGQDETPAGPDCTGCVATVTVTP